MEKVTVIIPNYNGEKFLKECLESLQKQSYPFEAIIVDNASHDKSLDYIKKYYPDFILIENRENMGFSAATNQGIKASKSEYIFLTKQRCKIRARLYFPSFKMH